MPLTRLSINNLRNIQQTEITPHSTINLFYGANGAGKTTLLEAINLLSVGRSFRHHRPKPLISYQSDELTVFAELASSDKRDPNRLGLSKSQQGSTQIRIDGEPVSSAARLAQLLPVLNLNAAGFDLIDGPPRPRRQLLDWLTFHVEPLFLEAWKVLQHCLKQRNSLLRRGKITGSELLPWDTQLTELAEKINRYRQNAFSLYKQAFAGLGDPLPGLGIVTLDYKKGWSLEQDFGSVLAQQLLSDRQRGFTQSGPHRADMSIKIDGRNAAEVLSRGQQKMVVSAMVIALGEAFRQQKSFSCVYLIDDLPSELDQDHRRRAGQWLAETKAQLFVTAVEKAPLCSMWPPGFADDASLFHVKQGTVQKQ